MTTADDIVKALTIKAVALGGFDKSEAGRAAKAVVELVLQRVADLINSRQWPEPTVSLARVVEVLEGESRRQEVENGG